MSGISRDMTMILWLSALVAAINFFASFLGASSHSYSIARPSLLLAPTAFVGRDGSDRQIGPKNSRTWLILRNSCLPRHHCTRLPIIWVQKICHQICHQYLQRHQIITFRQNTTAADTSAFEPSLPGDPSSIYATCADFMDCNACTQEYDDFVSITFVICKVMQLQPRPPA